MKYSSGSACIRPASWVIFRIKEKELVKEVVNYAFDFLKWKKAYVLKKTLGGTYEKRMPQLQDPAAESIYG